MSFKVDSKIPQATRKMTDITVDQFQDANEAFSGRIKELSPYDTGHNRRSIKLLPVIKKGKRLSWMHLVETIYGAYLELGTKRMAAQPYFRPAFDWLRKNLKRLLGL